MEEIIADDLPVMKHLYDSELGSFCTVPSCCEFCSRGTTLESVYSEFQNNFIFFDSSGPPSSCDIPRYLHRKALRQKVLRWKVLKK